MRKMKPSGVEWIGDIPQEWEIRSLKYLFDFGKGLPITKADLKESGIAVISYGQIHSKLNTGTHVTDDLIRFVDEQYLSSNYESIVKQKDFIFADTSEDLDGCGNCVYIDTDIQLFAGYHTIILRSRNNNDNKYFAYLFKSDAWRKQIRERVTGVKLFSISQRILKETTVIIPPFPQHQRIAAFLDRKCAEIDSIITKTKATIEQYKALKQSVITQAVTKGIRPDRQMKDSGIEWIGEIPQEWSKDKVFRAFSTIGSGTTPKSSDESNYEGNINWIQSGDINGRILSEVKNRLSIEAIDKYSALRIYTSPFIVIAMYGASIGNISISKIDSCVNQACCVLAEPKININYAFQSIKAAKNYLITKAVGGGQPNISQDIVKSLWLPIPPLLEQQEIADYLDRKCAEIDRLIAAKEQLLTELESYKKSVIYEYVTGKKEV